MKPFEFVVLFLSFIFTLALTHLLFAATRMIRDRRKIVFSWPHALWMLCALALLFANWLSLWDFNSNGPISIGTVVSGFLYTVLQYFMCALMAPDFEAGDRHDLKEFHAREGRSYLSAFLAVVVISLALNAAAGWELGIANWSNQNIPVGMMVPPILLAMFVRRQWVQVAAPLIFLGIISAFPAIYYPVLK